MIINRDHYLNQLAEAEGNGLIKIVTGLRRSGKSFLLKNIFKQHLIAKGIAEDHVLIIDMESMLNDDFRDPKFLLRWVMTQIKDTSEYYVIIDEVQEIKDFARVISSLALIDGIDVYVTGSNSRFLSTDVATEFRGRGEIIQLWPLSFNEFMSGYNGSKEDGLSEYLLYGGLPQLLSEKGDEAKINYLRNLYQTVYLRDIYERNKIDRKNDFETLSQVIASSIGSPVNPTKIANTFKSQKESPNITSKTISSYLEYMQESFLVEKAERYDIKGRKYIGTLSKYYFTDVGLRNSLLSFRQKEDNHLMENIIYNEMRMRGWMVDVGNISNRYRDSDGKQQRSTLEVDFVCNKGSNRIYIQSAWRIPDEDKMEQEKKPLKQISDSFRKMLIIGEHTKPWSDENGIQVLCIYDFLLNPQSTD
jgi:predicted AAA+ superfamily ATPase